MLNKAKDQISDEMKQKWDERIRFLRENVHLLTEWEDNFSISLEEQRFFGKILSPRQVKYLYQAYNRVDCKLG